MRGSNQGKMFVSQRTGQCYHSLQPGRDFLEGIPWHQGSIPTKASHTRNLGGTDSLAGGGQCPGAAHSSLRLS